MNEGLAQLHLARSPRIILGLRQGEQVPDWVTHILDVRDGTAFTIPFFTSHFPDFSKKVIKKLPDRPRKHEVGDVVVDMKDISVTYGTRKVK
jgi:hypothetical protein